ncbi:hypothetical protein [Streptomyces sp. DSM 15324]|nr:hypothetical protein [Streptomyces sp. DSM 15324]
MSFDAVGGTRARANVSTAGTGDGVRAGVAHAIGDAVTAVPG